MDSDKIQQYVLLAKGARGRAVVELIVKATSDPGVFGFGELLACQSVIDVGTPRQLAVAYVLLYQQCLLPMHNGLIDRCLVAAAGHRVCVKL